MERKDILRKKANDAYTIYEDLVNKYEVTNYPLTFIVDENRYDLIMKSTKKTNPFKLPLGPIVNKIRRPLVEKLFTQEKVVQTASIAAISSLINAASLDIANLRGIDTSFANIKTDIAFAGLQACRLYFTDYNDKQFRKRRNKSAVMVDNAWNGSFYKYKTKDDRLFSFHVYYESQKQKITKGLEFKKKPEKFTLLSLPFDKKKIAKKCKTYMALDLENKTFDLGACGCMIRTRKEWEESEVGKAVNKMPLLSFEDYEKSDKSFGNVDLNKGPLSGIKVLDLTHIIAGPAASRTLAELGADVLMIRRGDFHHQEQSMLELDGWVGKNSIQLDFNNPKDLEKAKELIKKADVLTYSYQRGCMDHFGLSIKDIHEINPSLIIADLNCFSNNVWSDRPGWAPCAEDITGLSARNGTKEEPINLIGVPLDYFPGLILAFGILLSIKKLLKEGIPSHVYTSLTRGAQYLHEASDLCEKSVSNANIIYEDNQEIWNYPLYYVDDTSLGKVGFCVPCTLNNVLPFNKENSKFKDGQKNFK